ncbi:MAG: nucleoside 2-deoxyribosyltransferase domain-containing protein [Planctomycetota bacterium]
MFEIKKPPSTLESIDPSCSVFLAGSIEKGHAEDWQSVVTHSLSDLDLTILNPRRDEWDATWEQSIHNARFRVQVEWELDAQERAGLIAMYFAPSTRAPTTLLELGLFARSGKTIVCCPDGYWRKGNVEIVCRKFGVPLVETLDEFVGLVRSRIEAKNG